jgi:hypothetical protein
MLLFVDSPEPFIFEFQRIGNKQRSFSPGLTNFLPSCQSGTNTRSRSAILPLDERELYRPICAVPVPDPSRQTYHDAVKAYEPYDKLVHPLPDMRQQTVKLVQQAI